MKTSNVSRKALIVVDCWRYRFADYFKNKHFNKLNKVVAVSNWTYVSIATMLTGLHPIKSGAYMIPPDPEKPLRVQFMNSIKQESYSGPSVELITDKYKSEAVCEVPVYPLLRQGLRYHNGTASKRHGFEKSKEFFKDKSVEFLYVHFKGMHAPWIYQEEQVYDDEHDETECSFFFKEFNKWIKEVVDNFDKIVVTADHGQLWDVDITHGLGHGGVFHKENLHIPFYYYSKVGGINIEDKLYDNRIAYDFLENKPLLPQQFVVSMSPAYHDYNKFAISYLVNNKVITDIFQSKQGWDL